MNLRLRDRREELAHPVLIRHADTDFPPRFPEVAPVLLDQRSKIMNETEPPPVILVHLATGVGRRREAAEARHVHGEDVGARIAFGHPARQH